MTGDSIDAIAAEKMNLITFAVAPEELDAFTDRYVERLARGAQTAIRFTKLTTNIALRQLFNSVFEAGVGYELLTRQTNDHREALRAFVEKRRPIFSGT